MRTAAYGSLTEQVTTQKLFLCPFCNDSLQLPKKESSKTG